MKITEFFDESFYINLDKRTDNREQFESELKKINLFDFVKRFSAIDATNTPPGDPERYYACAESHISIVEYAKNKNLKNILIFEDDAFFFKDESLEIIEASLDDLSKIDDWDVIYFGGMVVDNPLTMVDKNLLNVTKVYGTHAWGINSRCFDNFILNKRYQPMDIFVGFNDTFKKYISFPPSTIQKNIKSNISYFEDMPNSELNFYIWGENEINKIKDKL